MKKFLSLLMLGMFVAFLSLPLAYAAEHAGGDVKEHAGTPAEEGTAVTSSADEKKVEKDATKTEKAEEEEEEEEEEEKM